MKNLQRINQGRVQAILQSSRQQYINSNERKNDKLRNKVSARITRKPSGNKFEGVIQNSKAQFIALICTVGPQFTLQHWYKLVHQSTINFNMICASRAKPKIFTDKNMFVEFNFYMRKLAPPEKKVVMHNRS